MSAFINSLHYLYFDGTSYFVGDSSDIQSDYEIISKGSNLEALSKKAERLNEEIR
jgi:hypothetical protein